MDPMSIAFHPFLKQQIEATPVRIGKKDRLTAVAPEHKVVNPATQMESWFPGYASNLMWPKQNIKI